MANTLEIVTPLTEEAQSEYDVWKVRADFPLLKQTVHGKPLVYLDNANTTQKPQRVLDAMQEYYTQYNANIHRASYQIAERATQAYEGARGKVRQFLNAAHSEEIVFVRNATEGINLVAQTYGRRNIGQGDEIILSAMEHHANIVPWQMLCEEKGAKLRVIPITDTGELILEEFAGMLNPRTRLVGMVHMSNALGTVNPIRQVIAMAHAHGVPVLVDGAQSAYHLPIDVQALDCDFFVFSGHKLYGPTGIGVLYGKRALLEAMPPWQGGGDMISSVSFEKTTYNELPHKFEAGTPHIEGAICLGVAIDYLNELGMDRISAYEQGVMAYGTEALSEVPGAAHDRDRKGEGERILLPAGRYSCPGCGGAAGYARHRHPNGAALCASGDAALRRPGDRPAPHWPVTTHAKRSTSWCAVCAALRRSWAEGRFGLMADTQQEQATQIEDAFALFDDWEDRYQILIDLGRKLPPMDPADKAEENRVKGCQSNVWMTAHVENEASGKIVRFEADSDAAITKGLVAILWLLYSGQPVERILAFDIDGYLERLGLNQHLSMNRRNGLYSMVQRVKTLATTEQSK